MLIGWLGMYSDPLFAQLSVHACSTSIKYLLCLCSEMKFEDEYRGTGTFLHSLIIKPEADLFTDVGGGLQLGLAWNRPVATNLTSNWPMPTDKVKKNSTLNEKI